MLYLVLLFKGEGFVSRILAFSSGEGEPLAVDEESIFLNCTNGVLLIRHGQAVPPSPLGKDSFPAGEGLGLVRSFVSAFSPVGDSALDVPLLSACNR